MKTIKGLRADNGDMTQQELAEALGVATSTIQSWENNQPNLSHKAIFKLIEYFGVSADDLLGTKKYVKN